MATRTVATFRERRARRPPEYLRPDEIKRTKRVLPQTKQEQASSSDTERLYHLQVIQRDEEKDLMKVRYTGYSSDHDEWRNKADIIHLDEADDCSEEEDGAEGSIVHPFCLYDELAF